MYLTKSAIAITIRWTRSCCMRRAARSGAGSVHSFLRSPSFFLIFFFYFYFFCYCYYCCAIIIMMLPMPFWWLAKTRCTCKTRSHIEVPGLIKAVGRVALHSTSFRGRRSPLVDVFDSTTACGTLPRNALFLI